MSNCDVVSQQIVIGLLQILEPAPDIYVDSKHPMLQDWLIFLYILATLCIF